MNRQEIIDSWNAQADEYNQWEELGEDEKLEWAVKMEREACAKHVSGLRNGDDYGEFLAAAIRARGKHD